MIKVSFANNSIKSKLKMSINEAFNKYIQSLYFISNDKQKEEIKNLVKKVIYK